ncbi:MAG: hypothetical protein KDD36_13730 [Flavobacteriales bacterium]|nr:hypothetical protein [Flavobacteriales bacterium]
MARSQNSFIKKKKAEKKKKKQAEKLQKRLAKTKGEMPTDDEILNEELDLEGLGLVPRGGTETEETDEDSEDEDDSEEEEEEEE